MTDVVFFALLLLAALLSSLAIPVTVIGATRFARTWSDTTKMTIILVLLITGATLSIAFSGRYFPSTIEEMSLATIGASPVSDWISRIATAGVLLMASMAIWEAVFTPARGSKRFHPLVWAALAFYFLSIVPNSIFGHFRFEDFRFRMFYAPLLLLGMASLTDADYIKVARALRLALILPLGGSLLAAVAAPNLALEYRYDSFIPGLTVRLHGLAEHANTLGMLAVIGLMLDFSPAVRPRVSIFYSVLCAAVLVLAQSKTAWTGAVLGFALVRIEYFRHHWFPRDNHGFSLMVGIALLGLLTVAALAAGAAMMNPRFWAYLSDTELLTFTGRTSIWSITLDEFKQNPILGYGPALWDPQYRWTKGLLFAADAHNQYIQTLGQAGLLGFGGLVLYQLAMLKRSLHTWPTTLGLSFIMFAFLAISCVAEVPMNMGGIIDFVFMTHYLVFGLMVARVPATQQAAKGSESSVIA